MRILGRGEIWNFFVYNFVIFNKIWFIVKVDYEKGKNLILVDFGVWFFVFW